MLPPVIDQREVDPAALHAARVGFQDIAGMGLRAARKRYRLGRRLVVPTGYLDMQ